MQINFGEVDNNGNCISAGSVSAKRKVDPQTYLNSIANNLIYAPDVPMDELINMQWDGNTWVNKPVFNISIPKTFDLGKTFVISEIPIGTQVLINGELFESEGDNIEVTCNIDKPVIISIFNAGYTGKQSYMVELNG
tara:strand:- start:83 stop:493 length:411 start_codon:yes stop_codon:yes gene_type:complete